LAALCLDEARNGHCAIVLALDAGANELRSRRMTLQASLS
jgi:hypothetical protein